MIPQLAYGTVRDHPRKVIHLVRVLDDLLDYPEIHHLAEEMRGLVRSRHGEQTPDVVIVQGDSKETLRLFGEPQRYFMPPCAGRRCGSIDCTGGGSIPIRACLAVLTAAPRLKPASRPVGLPSSYDAKDTAMLPPNLKIIDISLELDPKNFAMRTPAGFKKDMQFAMEVIKEHDAPGGAGQIVRGVHMRLHAGSHVDAPEHNVRGGTQIHDLPLELFIGDAIIADLRDKVPGRAITADDLEKRAVGVKRGDRLLLRSDLNNAYDGGSEKWMKTSPYLTIGATTWCIEKPYTVSSNIISDMLSGAIQASFDPLAFVLSFLQNGSLRALAVGADAPVTEPVKIPTAASQGVDYHFATWYGILAPVKTPKPVLRILADAIAAASRDGESQQKIKAQGIRPDIVALDAFDSYIDSDLERLAPLTKGIAEK